VPFSNAHEVHTGATFPNVTLPDFELHGSNARVQADAVVLYFIPVIKDETRAGWEEYAAANRGWIYDAFDKENAWKAAQDAKFGLGINDEVATEQDNVTEGNGRMLQDAERPEHVTFEDGYNLRIHDGDNSTLFGSGPFLPLWQLTPVLPVTIYMNYDLLQHFAVSGALQEAIRSEEIVLSQAHDLKDPGDTENESESLYNAFLMAGQYRHDTALYEGDPTTNVIYPVFDSFGPNRTLGGVIMASMYWRLSFAAVLPETAKGVICVMENSLNQSFTYRLDGPKVTFLGPGDRHDPKYNHLVVSADVAEYLRAKRGPENEAFNAADINMAHCRYKLYVYPSQDTEAKYVNSEPITYTLMVAGVFLVTSLIFILYDWLVTRRQRIVMKKAVQSAAIVSSLYPKQVRDRMFQEGSGNKTSDAWRASLQSENGDRIDLTSYNTEHAQSGRPIADTYEACTVLFADLAGFTSFSATRKPEDVFYLLESLYQAFDKIAVRRKVFKIETVGQPSECTCLLSICSLTFSFSFVRSTVDWGLLRGCNRSTG
jgi:Adenylate and Guanylate cyclase catalytic domain